MAPSVSSTSSSTSTSSNSGSGSGSGSGSDSDSSSSLTSSSSSESLSSSSSIPSPSSSPCLSPSSIPTKAKVKAAVAAARLPGKRSLVPARWTDCSVRTIDMAECRDAALTLAHAFAADDYAQYLVADDYGGYDAGSRASDEDGSGVGGGGGWSRGLTTEEDKWRLHVDILTYTVASHCMSGLVKVVGAECDAVALWGLPGKHLDSWWTQLRSGMWRMYFQLSPEGRKRYFDEIVPRLHDAKVQVLGDRENDAWFLAYLGTKPNSQGRGYAAKLLRDMMARADAEKRPIYLESSSQANNAYYEKFGFEVKQDVFLERGPVPVRLSIMVREPRMVAYAASPSPSSSSSSSSSSSPMGKKKKFVVGAAKGLRRG